MLHCALSNAQTTLISPTGDGGFELGATPQANGWQIVQSSVDKWGVGNLAAVAPPSGNAAYISADNGVSWTYSQNSTVAHLFKTVTVPAGTNRLRLSFKWKVGGEGGTSLDYDNMKVFFVPDSIVPNASTFLPSSYQVLTNARTLIATAFAGMYKLSSASFTEDSLAFTVPAGNYKLVFQWKSNATILAQPPAAIDDVSLTATAPRVIASTPIGGLWNSPATWVGGAVPVGDDVLISAGSNVSINDRINIRNLTIAGRLQVGAANFLGVINGDLLVDNTGSFNAFIPTGAGTGTGMNFNVAGHFTNNGTSNFAVFSTLSFVGSQVIGGRMVQNLGGTGTFIGNDTCGIIRALFVQTTGTVNINTTQKIVVTSSFAHTAAGGTLNTNGKLTLNNGVTSIGLPFHQQVTEIVVTGMGAGYTSAPTVAISAPTGNGRTATAVADFDAATGTVRQIRVTDMGTGYRYPPTITLTGGGFTTAATAVVNHVNFVSGNTSVITQKSGGTIINGGLEIPVGQTVGGVYWSQSNTNNIGYTTTPVVGFTLPSGMLNLVTNGGSGYTIAPTVTLVGGTVEVVGTSAPVFSVNIAQGKVVSVIATGPGLTPSHYSTLPQIQLTGGDGTGATAAYPTGCLATATAVLDAPNQMIKSITITNPGFGYSAAPGAAFSTATNVATAIITNLFTRLTVYNVNLGYFAPSLASVPHTDDAAIPTHRRISNLTINNPTGANLNSNIDLYSSAPLTLTNGVLAVNSGNGTINCLNYGYAGTAASTEAICVNAKMTLTATGGATSVTRNFPFDAPVSITTGTNFEATTLTMSRTTAPSGSAVAPAVGVATGSRAYRLQTNGNALLGTAAAATLYYNNADALLADNATLFWGQGTSLTGSWTVRTTAAAAGVLPATGNRAATTAITSTGNDYFAWVTSADLNNSVATGNWNSPTTWSKGTVPTCTDAVAILANHNVTVNAAGLVSKNLTINPLGTLTVASGDLRVGCTGYNNPLALRGNLNVTGGTLNVNGNIDAILNSTFTQTGGDINVDGNDAGVAATSVAANVPLVKIIPTNINSVNLTGGTLTIVDPHASTTQTHALMFNGNPVLNYNVTSGHTLRLGNGVSTDAGGNATGGFYLDAWYAAAGVTLGNLTITGPAGTNRTVTSAYQLPILGDLTIHNGGDFNTGTVFVNGNVNVNTGGTLTLTNALYLVNAYYASGSSFGFNPSANPQTIANTGTIRNAVVSPTVQLAALVVNNSHTTGATLNAPFTTNYLGLTLGKLNTTTTNLLTVGSSTVEGTVTNGSSTAFVNGPLARTYGVRAAGFAFDSTALFPVGKGSTYMPIHLTPTTTPAGLQLRAEAFTTNPSTFNNPLVNLADKRWEVTAITNGSYMTATGVRITEAGITSTKEFVQANSGIGSYAPISVASTYAATALTTATTIAAGSFTGFLSYGERCVTPAVPTAAATQNTCVGQTVANLAATPISGATILWYNAAAGGSALASNAPLTTGNYYVAQSIGGGCESPRSAVAVTVNAVPTATVTSSGVTTVCDNQGFTLSANTGTGLTYQWQSNGAIIATATNATYVPMVSGAYQVIVTNASNCSTTSAGTNVTVYAAPTAMITSGATTVCQGQAVVMNATTGTGLTYQWQKDGSTLVSETNANYTAMASGSYTVIVTNANNCTTTSAATTVTVTPAPTATITANSTQICQGGTLVLNANVGTGLTYQWQNNGSTIANATNANYTATAAGNYAVIVTNTASGCSQTSAVSAITVNPLSSGAATISAVTPTSFCQGSNVVLNANTGATLRYTWQNNGVTIPNATASTYIATTSGVITVVILDVSSSCTATSAPTTVTVNPIPTPIINANANTAICQGDTVRLTASGGTTYLWSNNSTNATLAATTAGTYTVTVTSAANCSATTSQVVSIRALPTASVTAATPMTFCVGGNVTLNANTGSGFTYQWQNNGAAILGATNANYMTNAAGNYRVIVTGGNGCVSTSTANAVIVNALPTPIFTPSGVVAICQGDSARVQIAGGTSYVWSDNSTGTSIWAKAAGPYMVTVTDGNGCIATASKSLTVNALPMATVTAGGVTSVCPDDVVSLSANTGTGLMYQWRRNAGNITNATNRTFT
ncbi:MAG: putative adhesin, partial [Bacteroidota bacterium]